MEVQINEISHRDIEKVARTMRHDIVRMIHAAGSGHPGGSLSAVEILAVIYLKHLRHKPEDPHWDGRDRFVLSKGHAAPALYSILSETGYLLKEELMTLRKIGSRLQGHPVIQTLGKVPGVEFTTGPLGQGFSAACGMAKSFKIDGKKNRVYALLGDGECQEGQIWEAAMFASHYKLDNLTAIIDNNGLQIDGRTADVMCLKPLADKWKSFGFSVQTVDGHDIGALDAALSRARMTSGCPHAIIAKTIKGKGVSFKEDKAEWHGKAPNDEEARKAILEIMEGCD